MDKKRQSQAFPADLDFLDETADDTSRNTPLPKEKPIDSERQEASYSSHPSKRRASRSSKSKPEKKAYAGQMLNRWPRAFARFLDLSWEMTLVVIAAVVVFGEKLAGALNIASPGFYLLLLASLPVALLLDALIAGTLGNTPAKAIIGVKATTARGERLGLGKHLRRNFGVWTDGLAIGFLPVSIFSMLKQYKRVSGRREAFYDERLHVRVRSGKMPALRVLLALVALLALFFVLLGGSSLLNSTTSEQQSANESDKTVATATVTPAIDSTEQQNKIQPATAVEPETTVAEPAVTEADTQVADALPAVKETHEPVTEENSTEILASAASVSSTDNQAITPTVSSDLPATSVMWQNPETGLSVVVPANLSLNETINPANNSVIYTFANEDGTSVKLSELGVSINPDTSNAQALKQVYESNIQFDEASLSYNLGKVKLLELSGKYKKNNSQAFVQSTRLNGKTIAIESTQPTNGSVTAETLNQFRAAVWSTFN